MIKRFASKARKEASDFSRPRDDDPGTIHGLFTSGSTLNGSANPDFMFGFTATTINGNGGADIVLGDMGPFRVFAAGNSGPASAINLDSDSSLWSVHENALIGSSTSAPHTTVYVTGEGTKEYFSITIPAGQTITIDIDGGWGALGGQSDTDALVELYISTKLASPVDSSDNSSGGDNGSIKQSVAPFNYDPLLFYTNNTGAAALYYIRILEVGGDTDFESDDEFLLHVSLTGHAVGGSITVNNDVIDGGAGDDHLFGAGGDDQISGGGDHDRIDGGEGSDVLDANTGDDSVRGGAGNDQLRGGPGDDSLQGDAGNDILDGGTGADTMVGDLGDDVYYVDDPGDNILEVSGGYDHILTSVDYELDNLNTVERLSAISVTSLVPIDLTGNRDGNLIEGNNALNALRGKEGADTLYGFGGDDFLYSESEDSTPGDGASDVMYGGTGDDTYLVGDAGDVVIEAVGEGNDRVLVTVSYALGANAEVERLEILNTAAHLDLNLTGNGFAQTIRGFFGDDILRGEGGSDTLRGDFGNDFLVGGAGADIMVGGTGDDTYYVDNTSDAISEFAGQGFDRLAASITLALAADADIERLDVEDLTSSNAIDLTGSGIANVIYGNDGQNILRGEAGNDELRGFGGSDFLVGGTGTDLMVGGAGNDTFYVDDASDSIGEIAGEGNDRIAASVSFVLSNGANVELLEAVNLLATTAFDLTGSDSNNTITGNNGVNILRGEGGNDILSSAGGDDFLVGGTGNDNMTGGAGNDTYYVDSGADIVIEIAGEGASDRVAASVSYALSDAADVERLEAGTQGATNAMDLVGSAIANIILGNDGANILDGKGGSDTLTGFGGADSFAFTTALGAGNVDTIAGFVSGSDKIRLDDAVFAALAPGALNASAYRVNSAAQDADDRIIYNQATGQLFYDADGNGAGAQVQFATLQGAPALAASDFTVI